MVSQRVVHDGVTNTHTPYKINNQQGLISSNAILNQEVHSQICIV